jgi:hypothetical protein
MKTKNWEIKGVQTWSYSVTSKDKKYDGFIGMKSKSSKRISSVHLGEITNSSSI